MCQERILLSLHSLNYEEQFKVSNLDTELKMHAFNEPCGSVNMILFTGRTICEH